MLKVPDLNDISKRYEKEQTQRTLNLHGMHIGALNTSIRQRNEIIKAQDKMIKILKMMVGVSQPPLPPQTSLPPQKRKRGRPLTEKKVKFKLEEDNDIDFSNIFN